MPKRSRIWNHFERKQGEDPRCLICLKPVKANGNTTNLFKHLRINHNFTYEAEFGGSLDLTSDGDQPKIDETLNLMCSTKDGDANKQLNIKIAWWVIWNALPFRIVEQRGFKELIRSLNRSYKPPSRDTLRRTIANLYDVKSNQLKVFLSNIKWFSLTCDGWKDISNQTSFVGITVHFIDNYKLLSACIKADQFKGEATSERIESFIKNTCQEFDLNLESLAAITTDGAANYSKAAKSCGPHIHCVAHKINLVVEDALEASIDLVNLIDKVRTLVTAFKQSSVLMSDLTTTREENNLQPLKLIQDIVTRWNSTYHMIARYLELHQDISIVLLKHSRRGIDISDDDVNSLRQISKVLKPFNDVTEDISGELYVTISRIIPLLASVKVKLARMKPDISLVKALVERLSKNLQTRFGCIEKIRLFTFSTLLDPRFKKLAFSSPSDCSLQYVDMSNILSDVQLTQRICYDYDEADDDDDIWKDYDKKARSLSNPAGGMHNGLKHYLESDVIPRKADPLEYWKNNKSIYPQLHNLAMQYLCIQATSVPCERLFSKTGSIITDKRNRIKPKNVNILSFLESLPDELI
ncbi:E3 SUMO-protein ligase ZBED1-like [Panonychus citri]|uniref:E3 SUMO-protein ligase ZBED1-like n=1 Tax=Panonychus citri TaxID=50023 RepID=UPI002307EFEC|nr:E3 SUMO-protein ligase ZBED1-like [Panonychus citri]